MTQTQQVATTIRQQLLAFGQMKVWSWGATNWSCGQLAETKENFLAFKVNGLKFKGIVKVILDWSDTYKVQFIKIEKGSEVIKKEISNVYFDELTDKIDNVVEYTGDDESYKKALGKIKAF
jgi:hypothetical protein